VTVVARQIKADSAKYLESTVDAVKARLDHGIVVLGSVVDGKPAFAMGVSRDLKNGPFAANVILKQAASLAKGGAGGNAEFAKGGGTDPSKVQDVLHTAVDLIRQRAET
jgi:alanyl-tRNA synthetase